MEGRTKPSPVRSAKHMKARSGLTIRSAIAWLLLASLYAVGLSSYKSALIGELARDGTVLVKARHPKILNLFQASFYFFYEDQFVPGVQQALRGKRPSIGRIFVLSNTGGVLFDSSPGGAAPVKPAQGDQGPRYPDPEVLVKLAEAESGTSAVFARGFDVHVLIPSGQYGVLYVLDGAWIRTRVLVLFATAVSLALLAWQLVSRGVLLRAAAGARRVWRRFWRLRTKFLVTIVLINAVTGLILFYTLTSLQTRDQTHRIEKESILFSQFSTARVISDFTNYYYFYYLDRFLPEIKNTIASNENLLAVRIISRKTGAVLFDSEQAASGPVPMTSMTGGGAGEQQKADYPEDIAEQLKTRDFATRMLEREGQRLFSVVSAWRAENQDPLFWVEYVYSYQTLAKSIRAIREQILLDMVPSLAVSLVIAIVFAQLLISPIRRLVAALKKVSAGEYDVSVDVRASDEIGELVGAFNGMTDELRKKHELRKYLSDSTYRQVMNAAEGPDGVKLGGTRVQATVLFTDIRDFVAHCESLDAEEVTAMLNEYFSEMVEVVYKHGGEVDKFIGDALLAVFYAGEEIKTIRPVNPFHGTSSSGTALQAIYCALEMRERLAEFNERRRAARKNVIEIGVGITHGDIISGPIGAKDRMDFTVIGDVVNLANRIEKLSKTGKHTRIVFSNHVEEKVRGLLDYDEHSREKVRGKQEDVIVYELKGIRDLNALVANLSDPDAGLRRRSLELLGQSRNPDALAHVIPKLKDDDETVRLSAVLALGKLAPRDHEQALAAFEAVLREDASEKVLSAVISAFGRICTSERVFGLAPFLESPNERIVANAIEALGQVRHARSTDLILPKLGSRNNRIKANAAMALFASGHFEVIDTLKPMLMHSDGLMRSSAAFAIGELTSIAEHTAFVRAWKEDDQRTKLFLAELQECVPMLVALLKDSDPIVRRQAVIALGKIKDKSAVLPIIDMVDLRKNSRDLSRDILEALRSIGSHKLVREVIAKLQ